MSPLRHLLSILLMFALCPFPAIAQDRPHPCDVLDRRTAEAILGGALRQPVNGRNRDKHADRTIAGCMYFSAARSRPRTSIVKLFEYEYSSSQAAKRAFDESRSRQLDPPVVWENKPRIGESAGLWSSEDGLGILILKGNKVLDLQVSRQDWRNASSLPDLVSDVGARAVSTLASR